MPDEDLKAELNASGMKMPHSKKVRLPVFA